MAEIMDVSRWQGRIDWDAVKRSGKIDGVMLRVLGSKGGKPYVDPAFERNYAACTARGIPVGGYTKIVANLLDGIEVRLSTDYLERKTELDALAEKVVYTGPIDAYFDYKLGTLEYRSVRFENELLDKPNFQGNGQLYRPRNTVDPHY